MSTTTVSVSQAARVLGLPVSGVEALVGAGYLTATESDKLRSSDLKAFLARNSEHHEKDPIAAVFARMDGVDLGAEEILDRLELEIDDMARRAADIVAGTFPEAAAWTVDERLRFEAESARRFEAIITVTRLAQVHEDADLLDELTAAGGAAAFADVPLPQLLVIFRVARDLMVQSAVRAAEELGQEWGLALSVVLTKVLPALDRLADSVAAGYWSAIIDREQDQSAECPNCRGR